MKKPIFNSENTIVIADFDGTFTKKEVLGKKTAALMTILMNEKYLTKSAIEASTKLFEHYYPIETDPNIGEEEKIPLMQEWWERSFAVIRDCKISKETLLEVCRSPLLQWRDHLLNFVKFLNDRNIPLIIFSAGGFGKLAIEYLLKREGLLAANVQVLSNEILFDQDGYFSEIVQPIIHIANKNGDLLIERGLIKKTPHRRQCLVLGDGLDDVKMVRGIDFDFIYKVAFSSSNLEHFKQAFDLVLPVDGSYEPVIDLFD